MALPVVPIITAVTPLVMGAFDLYRRRSEAKSGALPDPGSAQWPRVAEVLQKRIQALDESDLEQARLLSDLSKNVEALARALESQLAEARAREDRLRRWLFGTGAAAALALVIAAVGLMS